MFYLILSSLKVIEERLSLLSTPSVQNSQRRIVSSSTLAAEDYTQMGSQPSQRPRTMTRFELWRNTTGWVRFILLNYVEKKIWSKREYSVSVKKIMIGSFPVNYWTETYPQDNDIASEWLLLTEYEQCNL